jgi:hypothetical protein
MSPQNPAEIYSLFSDSYFWFISLIFVESAKIIEQFEKRSKLFQGYNNLEGKFKNERGQNYWKMQSLLQTQYM